MGECRGQEDVGCWCWRVDQGKEWEGGQAGGFFPAGSHKGWRSPSPLGRRHQTGRCDRSISFQGPHVAHGRRQLCPSPTSLFCSPHASSGEGQACVPESPASPQKVAQNVGWEEMGHWSRGGALNPWNQALWLGQSQLRTESDTSTPASKLLQVQPDRLALRAVSHSPEKGGELQ